MILKKYIKLIYIPFIYLHIKMNKNFEKIIQYFLLSGVIILFLSFLNFYNIFDFNYIYHLLNVDYQNSILSDATIFQTSIVHGAVFSLLMIITFYYGHETRNYYFYLLSIFFFFNIFFMNDSRNAYLLAVAMLLLLSILIIINSFFHIFFLAFFIYISYIYFNNTINDAYDDIALLKITIIQVL